MGRHFFALVVYMAEQPKQYKTIEELIEILKERGCIIENKSFAKDVLSKVDYYRLKDYLLHFKDKESKEKRYLPNTKFEKVVSLHEFDGKLRSLLLHAINHIEITLRARLARIHVKNHKDPTAYLKWNNFKLTNKQIDKKAAESYCKKKNNQCHKVYINIETSEEMIFRGIEHESPKDGEKSEPLLLCQKEGTNTILVVPINQKAEHSLKQKQIGEKITLNKNMYERKEITKFLEKVDNIKKQKFKDKCDGKLPLWVVIESFTFGNLSHFYKNLKEKDQNDIAKEFIPEYIPYNFLYKYLESWLRCCTDLRNICAHSGVLYNHVFPAKPHGLRKEHDFISRKLWISILIIKWLYPFQDKWDKEFIPQIENIVNDSKLEDSDLACFGFPIKRIKIKNFIQSLLFEKWFKFLEPFTAYKAHEDYKRSIGTWKEELKKTKKESLCSWIDLKRGNS